MKKKLLFLLISVLTLNSFAQELILSDETITESYLIKTENSADPSQQVINYMFNELSRPGKRNRQSDQVIFSYKQTTRITRKANKINIYLIIKDFQSTSFISYRGFNLLDEFIPAKVEMNCQLTTKNNQSLSVYNIDASDFNPDKNEFNFSYTDTNNIKEFRFIVKSKKFTYNNLNKKEFNDKLSDIDRYFNSADKIKNAFYDLSTINVEDLDHLFDYDRIIKDVEHLIHDLEEERFEKVLNLRDNDPIHFHEKLKDLKFETVRRRDDVDHTIAILYQIYYNRALQAIVNGNELLAVDLLNKSLYNNPLYAPAALQLARIDYKNNRLDDAAKKIKDIYYRMKPDPETAEQCFQLVNQIYDGYLADAEELINQRSYQAALDMLYKTRDFCRSIPGYYCSEMLSKDINQAIYGIYINYVDNARNYLKNGDLVSAEKEVRKAMDYFNSNQSEIKSNSEAIGVLNEIKNQEYIRQINDGKSQLKAKNYPVALKTLQNAELLENQYTIKKSEELPGLLKQAAKPVILSDISKGLDLVLQNRIEDAKKIVMASANTQNSYNLSGDKDINKQMEGLRKKIFTQECINAQNEYDVNLTNAKINIGNKYYLLADQDFEKAFNVVDKYPECIIDKTEAAGLKTKYQPAVDFLNRSIAIDNDLKINRFSNVISEYIEIEKFYDQQQIVRNFGLPLLPMLEYISKQGNVFVIYAAGYYTTVKNYENALKLLDVIKSRGASSKTVKNEQKSLGTQLAIRDNAINKSQDPKITVLQYTRSDSWYKNLSKTYLKQWKKMK